MINVRGMGSLQNAIARQTKDKSTPYVGMPATIIMYTDRVAAQVTRVEGKSVFVRRHRVKAKHTGMTDTGQEWELGELEGEEREFTLRKNGKYVEKGSSFLNGLVVWLGVADHYHDYSF